MLQTWFAKRWLKKNPEARAAVRSLIEKHGGMIAVDTAPVYRHRGQTLPEWVMDSDGREALRRMEITGEVAVTYGTYDMANHDAGPRVDRDTVYYTLR